MSTLLVDGHYYLHRVMHVPDVRMLSTANKKPTGAVFAILKMLRATLYQFRDIQRVVFVLDGGHSARRVALHPEYKRRESEETVDPDGLTYLQKFSMQMNYLKFLLPKAGVKVVQFPGREGDDIIGLLARGLTDQLRIVASDDRDMLQLVDDHVHVWRPMAEERVSVDNFERMTGCKRAFFLLRKAVLGDSSDNVPGIRGVGEKTFAKVLEELAYDIGAYPYEKLFEFALDHDSKKIQAIGTGFDTIMRNFELLDIAREEFSDEERAQAISLATAPSSFDVLTVKDIFTAFEFFSLVTDFASWIVPFQTLA